jgi:hypothetical protein
MVAVQTTYTSRHAPLALGQFDNMELKNTVTRTQEDATAVGYGRAMFRGTGDAGVTATASAFFEGVTVRTLHTETATDVFAQRESITLLNMGVIAVAASVAVNRGEQAYVTAAGLWTNVVGTNTLIAGAKFDATIAAAGLVPLRVK